MAHSANKAIASAPRWRMLSVSIAGGKGWEMGLELRFKYPTRERTPSGLAARRAFPGRPLHCRAPRSRRAWGSPWCLWPPEWPVDDLVDIDSQFVPEPPMMRGGPTGTAWSPPRRASRGLGMRTEGGQLRPEISKRTTEWRIRWVAEHLTGTSTDRRARGRHVMPCL